VFVDTGLEYPEIRDFVRMFRNITWLKPKKNFRKVIEDYGYPFISKEVSHKIHDCRTTESKGKESYVRRQLNGTYVSKNGKTNMVNIAKWGFTVDAPFKISHMCCNVMKKQPTTEYTKKTGRQPITAQLAEESVLRRSTWMKHGCNAFGAKKPMSNPMSFWREQDVLQYIRTREIEIASVYGNIIEADEIAGQMALADYIEAECPLLKTTGCDRTGCMFCGFGAHLEKPGEGRFERLKITHPKIYEYIMKPWDAGGLGYKEVIDWLNENGNLHIRY
jgi:3'-phosphoadenosine 5'-phosphosulfate sulfotransferase (PAPS reductase)/FAD synthetase